MSAVILKTAEQHLIQSAGKIGRVIKKIGSFVMLAVQENGEEKLVGCLESELRYL